MAIFVLFSLLPRGLGAAALGLVCARRLRGGDLGGGGDSGLRRDCEDDGRIVIDEVVGQLVTLAPLLALPGWRRLRRRGSAAGRDRIRRIPGVGYLEAGARGLGGAALLGGLGVMLDDRAWPVCSAPLALGAGLLRPRGAARVKAEILTIGDELLRGEIVDSNKAFLAERLLQLEIETRFQSSVRDDPDDMRDAFLRAPRARGRSCSSRAASARRATTSPSEVLAQTFGRELVLARAVARGDPRLLRAASAARWPRTTRSRRWFPEGAEVLDEPVGTAPGCMLEVPAAPRARGRALLLPARACRAS